MNQEKFNYWKMILLSSIDPTSTKKYYCSFRGLQELFQPPQDQITEFKRAIKKISLWAFNSSNPHTYNWGKMGRFYLMPSFKSEWMEKALIIQQSIPSPYKCSICNIQLERKRLYCSECAEKQQKKLSQKRYNDNREYILLEAKKNYKKKKKWRN